MGEKGSAGKIRWNTELFPDNEDPPAEGELPEERSQESAEASAEANTSEAKPKLRSRFKEKEGSKTEDAPPVDGPGSKAEGRQSSKSREDGPGQQTKGSVPSSAGAQTTAAVDEDENMMA